MTGFGRGEAENDGCAISIEVRSVNHRFLDVAFKLPASYSCFEHRLVKCIKGLVKRGRIDVVVSRKDKRESSSNIRFNRTLFDAYIALGEDIVNTEISSKYGISKEMIVSSIVSNALNKREIVEFISAEECSVEKEYELVEKAFTHAIDELVDMRRVEGLALVKELKDYIDTFEGFVARIESEGVCAADAFKARLEAKLQRYEPGVEIDPQRLAQEVVMLVERADYSEEVVRLKSHIVQFRDVLITGGGGRKLDFLTQEVLREINTIGSKAQNALVSSLVVESKTLVEKIKEQIQNVE